MKKVFISIIICLLVGGSLTSTAEFSQLNNLEKNTSNTDNLIAHWTFSENEGNILYDKSGNGFHGSIFGNPEYTDGKIDKALLFDADEDYIAITENTSTLFSTLSELGQGSISIWFRVDYIPVDYGIMPIFYYGSKDPCDEFFDAANQGLIIEVGHSPIHYGSKRIYFTIWANGCTYPSFCFDSREPLTEGIWYHFVAVVGPDYNTGYLNGVEMDNRRYNFGNSKDSQFFEDAVVDEALWFGKGYWDARRNASPLFFDGAIDDIRIFNTPLNDGEVKDIYQEGTTNNPPNKPQITGPINGKSEVSYTYNITSVDPDGDDIYYWIEWFDGCPGVNWQGPYSSGEKISFDYSWNEQGTFTIRVIAKDIYDAKSDMGTLQVTMPKHRSFHYRLYTIYELLTFFHIFKTSYII